MLNLVFTLDYEIHGNGDGSPYKLMLEPTYRLMNLMEKYGAKLTVLADIAEILCFKTYFKQTGKDLFYYKAIEKQLQNAVQRGHDVQLHIHSSYFKAKFNGKNWEQCWEEYNMASLDYQRINEMIKAGIDLLNEIILPVKSDYKCKVFRAANWSMMPTENIYKALVNNGIKIDTSVYKGGVQKDNIDFDYTNAHSNLFSYHADNQNINLKNKNGELIEFPIYTEMRYFWNFLTPIRFFRMIRAKFHRHKTNENVSQSEKSNSSNTLNFKAFFHKSAWKLDFNQASGFQMKNALKRIRKLAENQLVDVVLIGHSKTFVPYNERTLEKFLKWAAKQQNIKLGVFPKI